MDRSSMSQNTVSKQMKISIHNEKAIKNIAFIFVKILFIVYNFEIFNNFFNCTNHHKKSTFSFNNHSVHTTAYSFMWPMMV